MCPFFRWSNWGTECFKNLLRVTQLIGSRARIQSRTFCFPDTCSAHYTHLSGSFAWMWQLQACMSEDFNTIHDVCSTRMHAKLWILLTSTKEDFCPVTDPSRCQLFLAGCNLGVLALQDHHSQSRVHCLRPWVAPKQWSFQSFVRYST